MGWHKWLLVAVLGVVAAGCDGPTQVAPPSDTGAARPESATPVPLPVAVEGRTDGSPEMDPGAAGSAIDVQVVDRQGYDRLLAAHRGKVVLVDFWATWCPPCVKQFPHSVELAHRYADQGLAVVSVSIDDPDELDRVRAFLVKQKATIDNLLADAGGSDATANAFGLDAGVPQYRVYDRSGKLVQSFAVDPQAKTQFTPGDVERAVKEALGSH